MSRGDTFQRQLKDLKPAQAQQITNIKARADALLDLLYPPTGRENALAITKLEECVFWAVKGAIE